VKFERGEFLAFVQAEHAAVRVKKSPLTGIVVSWARHRRGVLPWMVMVTWDYEDMTNGFNWFRGRRPMWLMPGMGAPEWLTDRWSGLAGIFQHLRTKSSL
jgi:hypothetical protein